MVKTDKDINKTINTNPADTPTDDQGKSGKNNTRKRKKKKDKTIRRIIIIIVILLLILLILLIKSCNDKKRKADPEDMIGKETVVPVPKSTPMITSTITSALTTAPAPSLTPAIDPKLTPTPDPAELKTGDSFLFGVYEQDNDLGNGKEPIEWTVLSNEDGELFIVSKYAIEGMSYNKEYEKATWETCTLRQWLNEDFLNEAFTEDEISRIKTMELKNGENKKNGLDGGNDTTDRVFLLSYDDVVNPEYGFSKDYRDYDVKRRCSPSVYARENAEYSIWGNDLTEDGLPGCIWWIRMPGIINDETGGVNGNGQVSLQGFPDNAHMGVRPALCLQLNPVNNGTPTPTNTQKPTNTPVPTSTPVPDLTPEPTKGPKPTFTPSPEATPTPKPTVTPTPALDPTIAKLVNLKTGDTFTYGSYEQDNDLTNGTEPIEWIVLSNKKSELYVMSRYALDAKPYHEEYNTAITWADCTLRKWLNEYFLNTAFDEKEKSRIKTKLLKNADNPVFGTEGGEDTQDKLFLMSYEDMGNPAYGFNSKRTKWDPPSRRCTATEYAVAQGVKLYGNYQTAEGEDVCYWWIRMAGCNGKLADAEWDGTDYRCSGMIATYTFIGVRPAMCIDLSK